MFRAGLAIALLLAIAAPAFALEADPARSSAYVRVPGLAPGAWGLVPVAGELDDAGHFVLHVPLTEARTNYPLGAAFLRRFLPGMLTLELAQPHLLSRRGGMARWWGEGAIALDGRTHRLPLEYRVMRGPTGATLSAYLGVPLARYGIAKLGGGDPGDVRVSLEAFFPAR
ncbi:MAG TPA: hypothetical protein V6D47_01625 [Oscillatoriaceae cyanobacterium]